MARKMTIAYLVLPAEGGIKSHVLTLLEGLDKERFSPVLICPRDSNFGAEVRMAGIKVYPTSLTTEPGFFRDLKAFLHLRWLLMFVKADVLHIHGHRASVIARLATAFRLARPRIIITVHRFFFDDKMRPHKRKFIGRLERFLAFFFTDRYVAVSNAVAEEMMKDLRLDPKQITVVHKGIKFADAPRPKTRPGNPEAKRIGTVSSLVSDKGVDDFLRAALVVQMRFPSVRVIVVGDGPARDGLERLTGTLGIMENVEFLGHQKDVSEVLATLDVFALGCTRENFGQVILEAMAEEVPVVACNVGAVKEIIRDGENGFLTPPANPHYLSGKICELLENRELAREMAHAGRESALRRFNSTRMIEEIQRIYLRRL